MTMAAHKTFVQDIAYDYYGKRVVTTSADHQVCVYESDEQGKWHEKQCIREHRAPVNCVSWAHPEFGRDIFTTCSNDRQVRVYELSVDSHTHSRTWRSACTLTDALGPVSCVAFAPRHMGLKLASCSLDKHLRIYEAPDILKLSFTCIEQIDVGQRCHSLSFNPNPFDQPMVAVATDSTVLIYAKHRRWQLVAELKGHTKKVSCVAWAPNMGRSHHIIATACTDKSVRLFEVVNVNNTLQCQLKDTLQQPCAAWKVAWNVTGTTLSCACDDGSVRLYKSNFDRQWTQTQLIQTGLSGAGVVAGAGSS